MAGRPGRDEPAHPSFPPSVHQSGALPGNDWNGVALDAELVHWIGHLGQDHEFTVRIQGPRLREPSCPQLGAVDACVSLASDDGSPWTGCGRPLVSVLAYRERRQPPDHLGKIFRLWAADHAALHAPHEQEKWKCPKYKCKRHASPPHTPSLSGRCADASDRNHTRGGVAVRQRRPSPRGLAGRPLRAPRRISIVRAI